MLKIRIITIHGIPNFGSVFQSYALCEYLKSQGYDDVQTIDYNPKYYQSRSLRAILGRLLNFKKYHVRKKKFRSFIEQNIPLTKKSFKTVGELEKFDFSADVYIAGGDQLWNVYHTCGTDDAYKLTWIKGKKISYATSMGQTEFTDAQLQELAEKIRDFSAVSVRESSSVPMLERVGINAVHCVDPVYLLGAADYKKFIKPINQPKYMLVYLITPSEVLNRCIDILSKAYGLKVILCSGFSKKCSCDEFLKDLGPDEILSYIYHADIVLSSSFHATSFSLIFKKQFFTILPGIHTNERIVDLLTMRKLTDRIVTEQTPLQDRLKETIDYESLPLFTEQIEHSQKYLKGMLADDR